MGSVLGAVASFSFGVIGAVFSVIHFLFFIKKKKLCYIFKNKLYFCPIEKPTSAPSLRPTTRLEIDTPVPSQQPSSLPSSEPSSNPSMSPNDPSNPAPTFLPTPLPTGDCGALFTTQVAPFSLTPDEVTFSANAQRIPAGCVFLACFPAVDNDVVAVFDMGGAGCFDISFATETVPASFPNWGIVVADSTTAPSAFCGAQVVNPADANAATLSVIISSRLNSYIVVGPSPAPTPPGTGIITTGTSLLYSIASVADGTSFCMLCGQPITVTQGAANTNVQTTVRADQTIATPDTCPVSVCPTISNLIMATVRIGFLNSCFRITAVTPPGGTTAVQVGVVDALNPQDTGAICVAEGAGGVRATQFNRQNIFLVFGPAGGTGAFPAAGDIEFQLIAC